MPVLGLLLAFAQADGDVEIGFALLREPELLVEIAVAATGAASGETVFLLSENWGGVQGGGTDLAPIGISGRDGRELELETPAPHRWRVRHDPGERLALRYRIPANDHQASGDPGVFRRPILNESLFHTVGYLALFLPEHFDGELERTVRFRWRGFEDAGWKTACSFGLPQEGALETATTLDRVRHALYAAGRLRLQQREVRGSPLLVSLSGDEWGFEDADFLALAASIVEAERAFFQDFERPFYWISLIPAGPELPPESANMSGTGLSNCFSLALHPNAVLEGAGGMSMAELLAHEMFHDWNGITIRLEEPEELGYWFSEGFTNFYARRLLLRAGLTGLRRYADSASDALRSYLTSPVRDAPNERIREQFWSDPQVQKLPYLRGDVVAMLVDHAIRTASSGTQSLDDVMRELLAEARRDGRRAGTEALLGKFAERAGAEAMERIRRIVVDGAMAQVPDDLFAPCLALERVTAHAFDLGFDLERSMQEKTVHGLRAGSSAEAAGLQEGQELLTWSVYHGDTGKEAQFTIREDGKQRTIAYLPRGAAFEVPRFVPRAGVSDCSQL
ncbi:MAG: hypothetical protein EYC70_12360 [Planctomycetota bacterium]|nr:MAG: hypothetical protein EYC70_12360 [Planctomycetota bacterium]